MGMGPLPNCGLGLLDAGCWWRRWHASHKARHGRRPGSGAATLGVRTGTVRGLLPEAAGAPVAPPAAKAAMPLLAPRPAQSRAPSVFNLGLRHPVHRVWAFVGPGGWIIARLKAGGVCVRRGDVRHCPWLEAGGGPPRRSLASFRGLTRTVCRYARPCFKSECEKQWSVQCA